VGFLIPTALSFFSNQLYRGLVVDASSFPISRPLIPYELSRYAWYDSSALSASVYRLAILILPLLTLLAGTRITLARQRVQQPVILPQDLNPRVIWCHALVDKIIYLRLLFRGGLRFASLPQ
jgi:hypothetical protein